MYLGGAVAFLAVAICEVASSPLPDGAIAKRAPPGQCGDHQYTTQQAQDAYDEALGHLRFPPTTITGGNGASYPRYFGNAPDANGNVIVFGGQCASPNMIDLQEYPIFRDGSAFVDGKNPDADRVVIARIAEGSSIVNAQCGIMTHEGAAGQNNYIKCS